MCSDKRPCVDVVEKLIKAKEILSKRIPELVKLNNYKGIEHIVKEECDKVYNELFIVKEK